MNNSKSRRRYTTEFKLEAIRLVKARGGRVTEVTKNLGIHPNMLHRWIKAHKKAVENCPLCGVLTVCCSDDYLWLKHKV